MSMQDMDAPRQIPSSSPVFDLPPPSYGALQKRANSHAAVKRRRAAERQRADEIREARALGVSVVSKTTVDRTWSAEEDEVLKALYPDYNRMNERLPHRSREAVKHRVSVLNLTAVVKRWTPAEVATLKKIWAKASRNELKEAIPRWSLRSIDTKATSLKLKLRGKPALVLTGNTLCDSLRDRCRELGYSMPYLDQIARTGTYFQNREWKGKSGHRSAPMVRAVDALGGDLRVEWSD